MSVQVGPRIAAALGYVPGDTWGVRQTYIADLGPAVRASCGTDPAQRRRRPYFSAEPKCRLLRQARHVGAPGPASGRSWPRNRPEGFGQTCGTSGQAGPASTRSALASTKPELVSTKVGSASAGDLVGRRARGTPPRRCWRQSADDSSRRTPDDQWARRRSPPPCPRGRRRRRRQEPQMGRCEPILAVPDRTDMERGG